MTPFHNTLLGTEVEFVLIFRYILVLNERNAQYI